MQFYYKLLHPFFSRNVINSSVYCNDQNLNNFHVFLVQITAFGFLFVACLIVSKLPRADLEIAPILVTFFYHLILIFLTNLIMCTDPYKNYVGYLCF